MKSISKSAQSNPIRWAGSLQAVILAFFGLLQVFNLFTLTKAQIEAILIFYGALMALLSEVLHNGSKKDGAPPES